MTRVTSALAALFLSVLALVAAPAQAFDDASRAAMTAAVERFNAAFTAGDYAGVFDSMPPKIVTSLAAQAGMEEPALLAAMAAEIEAAMATVTLERYTMDTAAATYATTPDGKREYALIPTETRMSVKGAGRFRATSQTLAFQDTGTWYLVRIDEPQQARMLAAAYPEFTGVDFPPGTMESIE